ncbi:hypothetical protein C8J57DRAFT_1259060 [Mycena rebaudengoi]|nr:hypothetical protein C8J57DRAFT_1259060 [Mycena rebaudengoi]
MDFSLFDLSSDLANIEAQNIRIPVNDSARLLDLEHRVGLLEGVVSSPATTAGVLEQQVRATPQAGFYGGSVDALAYCSTRAKGASLSGCSETVLSDARPGMMPVFAKVAYSSKALGAFTDVFLLSSASLGFFLDTTRFRSLVISELVRTSSLMPVMQAVFLWGAALSGEPVADQLAFLSEAVRQLQHELDGSQPMAVLHAIQAEVLVALFLLRLGRLLEAKSHAGSAVGLVSAIGLHRLGSGASSGFVSVDARGSRKMPWPSDPVEACERRNCFWSVYLLQATMELSADTAGLARGPCSFQDWQITTPWPMDVSSLDDAGDFNASDGRFTIVSYLSGEDLSNSHASVLALVMKAVVLLQHAIQLQLRWTAPDSHTTDADIDQELDKSTEDRLVFLARSLLDAAIIKIHNVFYYARPASRTACVEAAADMFALGVVNIKILGIVHPIMGALWAVACATLAHHVGALRSRSISKEHSEMLISARLRDGLDLMQHFSENSDLMETAAMDGPLLLCSRCPLGGDAKFWFWPGKILGQDKADSKLMIWSGFCPWYQSQKAAGPEAKVGASLRSLARRADEGGFPF